ncbi:UbiD family decarboxylase [Sporosalibacterium faouarense]|uniref:UbiD family decarboxylase n=1 Tax=Sporosalibacterium faouarense TaxID=516123 RepID=UPI00192B3D15|nr:UbiD family decarboxylase [Sporosalibacterium faouarense]
MERQMMRAVIDKLSKLDDLKVCNVAVDPEYELGAVLSYFENEQPILFNKVKGYDMPLIGGVYGNRKIYYDLMDVSTEDRLFKFMSGIANPIAPKLLNNGPIKENIITRNIDIRNKLPIPKSNEKDASSFITSGMLVVKDHDTGKVYMAVRRFQINGKDHMNALISPASPLLRGHFAELENKGEPLECAVVLGYDAQYLLASQISSEKYGVDKYGVDGGLRGEPLEVVKCHSVDLEVPAYAEMVLEGYLVPNRRDVEGPFGELMGYYGEVAPNPVMEIKTIMHRNNPIFQHAYPSREEHLANGLIREMEVYNCIKNMMVDVKDVRITVGGGCRFHAIISINKKSEGDGKSAILGALGSSKDIKHVLIVDEDIDIYDYKEVELALASRVQASEDVVIVPRALGSGLEASHVARGVTDKMGIDATKPLGEKTELFERAVIPGFEKPKEINIERYFPEITKASKK